MDKKNKANKVESTEKIEREYTIPLRKRFNVVPRYKKTNKAVKTIKEFLVRHMKIRDRDLKKIKIDRYLNEFMWFRGIRNPPAKVKVKVREELSDKGKIIRVELADFPKNLKFKKAREEKREKMALEKVSKKKIVEKPEEKKDIKNTEKIEEKKDEEKEKKSAIVEAGKEIEKTAAKQAKHQTGGKSKQPKHQVRKTLNK